MAEIDLSQSTSDFNRELSQQCCSKAVVIQAWYHVLCADCARSEIKNWSGARDLNPGPHGPEPCALPNCASPRHLPSELGDSTEEFAYRSVVEAFGEVDNSASRAAALARAWA